MRVITERRLGGKVRYHTCHVLAPQNHQPVREVRMTGEDFAALHDAFDHPGIRGWCEKMMTLFPELGAPPAPAAPAKKPQVKFDKRGVC